VPPSPQNVLISSSGLLKVADLGISQVLDHVFTRALVRLGGPHPRITGMLWHGIVCYKPTGNVRHACMRFGSVAPPPIVVNSADSGAGQVGMPSSQCA
jgi:hypothetical protein